MRRILNFIIPVAICFLVGFIASYLQSDSVENWYPYLNKPDLIPPNSVFPIAWSILYLFIGISLGLILNTHTIFKPYFIRLFAIQLFFNFLWSILFFYLQNPLLGMIDIVLLDILIIVYAIRARNVSPWASILYIPYILWVTFAAYLNLYILINNP